MTEEILEFDEVEGEDDTSEPVTLEGAEDLPDDVPEGDIGASEPEDEP